MKTLPIEIYHPSEVRQLERLAIEQQALPAATLMARAGAASLACLRQLWPQARRILVVCGTGNNGGDGFVTARLAQQCGLDVTVILVDDPARLRGEALQAYTEMQGLGVPVSPFLEGTWGHYDVVVDALFGIGLDRPVGEPWRSAIMAINNCGLPVLALDIPSGLHPYSGKILGVAVRATATVTFLGLKLGMFTGHGSECSGQIVFDNLQVPARVYAQVRPAAVRIDAAELPRYLPRRLRSAHKGFYGHVLVVGGNLGMGGAARLAAEAAARVGAGLVSIATHPRHAATLNLCRPELMCHAVQQPQDLAPLLKRATVVVIGPGLGQDPWAQALLGRIIDTALPIVIDADGLNLLALEPHQRQNWVLTPHPREAARLLGYNTADIEADRLRAARDIVQKFGGVCLLKGAGTLVCTADGPVAICTAGNPGMASGGMGDVLSGVIGGLLAQGLAPFDAARLGADLHARAGDLAAAAGERGMLAGDLMLPLRTLVNPQPGAQDEATTS